MLAELCIEHYDMLECLLTVKASQHTMEVSMTPSRGVIHVQTSDGYLSKEKTS